MSKKYENLTREMEFLMAVKPFIAEHSHDRIDSMLEMMCAVEGMKKAGAGLFTQPVPRIQPFGVSAKTGVGILSAKSADIAACYDETRAVTIEDDSYHNDGVYDVDEKCLQGQAIKRYGCGLWPFFTVMMATRFSY